MAEEIEQIEERLMAEAGMETLQISLSFLAGVYGMNFKYIPELEFRWSYGIFWAIIVAVGTAMILFFRRKKWF